MEIILKLVPSICILITTIVAVCSLSSWRRQFHGKRQTEIAEEVLTLFYQTRDAILTVFNLRGSLEEQNIECSNGESDEQYKARKQYSYIIFRLNKHNDTYSRLYSLRYRFIAILGKDKEEPFKIFDEIMFEIQTTFEQLIVYASSEKPGLYNEKINELIKLIHSPDSPIINKVKDMMNKSDEICSKVINKYN